MKKLDFSQLPKKLKPNPLFKGMSNKLKDHKNFDTVEKALQEVLKIDHTHKTALSYSKCAECNTKRVERQKKMKELGFKSLKQYVEWKKIHIIIKNKSNFQIR